MKMMIINPCNEVYLVMWLALSSSRSTPLYSMFMHTGSELYVCPTTCASLSSGRQHLVICDLEINTVIMCGSLFILSRRSVFSKLNRFCHSVGTSLGLSHCVDHIRGGLLGRWTPPRCSLNAGSCSGPAPSSAYLNSVFTDGVWHAGPYRSLGGAGRSGVKWSETGKGRGQGKRDSIEWRRDGGGGRLRPHWKGAQS